MQKITGTWSDDPSHFNPPNRREFLRVGAIGCLGLSLGEYFTLSNARAEDAKPAASQPQGPPAEAVIQIFLGGGISHIDTFDPKPDAAIEIRGELGTAKTNTGEQFSGVMPNTAALADKIAVVRSFGHGEAAHERGTHNMLTGYRPSPAIVYPSMGAVVAHEYGPRKNLPPYVCVPGADDEFLGTGYLSSAFGAFSLGSDPGSNNFKVRDLDSPGEVDEARFARRKTLLATVDDHFRKKETSDELDAMDAFYQRAYSLISSPEARAAFDLNAEDGKVRDEYGRNEIGQRLLMARRLVESGVRFVTVLYGGWDMHTNIRDAMRGRVPPLDQAYATLIRDLDRRGLLGKTLVALTSEFGRTSRINRTNGRDHWPKVFSVALAGAGVKGGTIHGMSDPTGSEPADKPVGPADLAATIFNRLGIEPEKELMADGGRPIEIVRHGKVIQDLL
jgi:hypothetical protein